MISLPDLTHEPAAEDATHDGCEGDLELLVGHNIDYWIEGRVKIACIKVNFSDHNFLSHA